MPHERIGFIGAGIMGAPMAGNLLKAGYKLTVHNRTKTKTQKLLNSGASWADCSDNSFSEVSIIKCVVVISTEGPRSGP